MNAQLKSILFIIVFSSIAGYVIAQITNGMELLPAVYNN